MKKYLIIAGFIVTIIIIVIVIGIYALTHRTGNEKTPTERAGRQSQNLY
ncbi:MAG: hypothetical protein ACRDFC_01245 [Ignavibacteria bacterium]